MTRLRFLLPILLLCLVLAPVSAQDTEVLEINPLAEKDLSGFKREGEAEWKIDDVSDDVYTLIVCSRPKSDTSLLFRGRTFKSGFRLIIEVMGGSKNKNLEAFIVPVDGERVQVPFSKRWLGKKGWHKLILTFEDGKAWVKVDDEKGDKIDIGQQEVTFALKLKKRGEAMFRKPKIQYLVVSQDQVEPEEGFVRIFDGKSLDGWKQFPEGVTNFTIKGKSIDVKVPMSQERPGEFAFMDGIFKDYVLRLSAAQGARNLILVGRFGTQDGSQRPVTATIESYFPGDKDWNQIEWTVKGRKVSLAVNGNPVWSQEAPNDQPCRPVILVGRDGHAKIRDIRVKGENLRPGPSWARYAAASGLQGGDFGGRGGQAAKPPAEGGHPGGGQAPQQMVLFNGKDLDDWRMIGLAGAFQVYDGRIVGLTLEKEQGAGIYFKKLLFFDYRVVFKLQRGSKGVKFIARNVPKSIADRTPVEIEIKDEWFADAEWTEFEANVWGQDFKLKVGDKLVASGKVPKEQGVVGFLLAKDSSMAVKDVVYHRQRAQ